MKVLLPSGAAAAAMGLVLTASPAHAVTWESHTQTGASSTDPGGVYAISALQRADGETGGYWSEFNPDGEHLYLKDAYADGHSARATVLVFDKNGTYVDGDTFYAATADGWMDFNLGTPDGSGDIPEGYRVSIRVCINDTTTCSAYAKGFA